MARVTLLAIRPHPDDECTGTGGIIGYFVERGHAVGVLTCTGGEEGEILDPELNPDQARPRLREIREGELRGACEVLGVSEVRLLGYRDSGMQGTPSMQRPDAFCNQPLDEAGGRVATIIRELQPSIVVTENANGTYGHPDHVMCHKVSVRGVELAADPAFKTDGQAPWSVDRLFSQEIVVEPGSRKRLADMIKAENLDPGWFGEDGGAEEIERLAITPAQADAAVDVGAYIPRMRQALAMHRTQIPPGSFLLTWPDHVLREVFRTAYFRQIWPDAKPNAQLADLLEGLPSSRP
ncbi:MAG TPA: PIG-L family deacetylase [Chloroflexota bacterium]|nr:PIG-L family deacetylase [Chloroflexota bacterium]